MELPMASASAATDATRLARRSILCRMITPPAPGSTQLFGPLGMRPTPGVLADLVRDYSCGAGPSDRNPGITAFRTQAASRGRSCLFSRRRYTASTWSPIGRLFRVRHSPFLSLPDHMMKPRSRPQPQAGLCVTTTSASEAILVV